MTPHPPRTPTGFAIVSLVVTIALGAAGCGGDDDAGPAPGFTTTASAEPFDVTEILARIRAGDIVLPSQAGADDPDDGGVIPMPPDERRAALDGRRYLGCTEWGVRIAEDGRIVPACTSWSFSTELPPIGKLDLRCTWCPESLPTGIDAPERPLFRPIDIDDPARFWDNADNAIRLNALRDSIRAGTTAPDGLPQWLVAVRANRPVDLTSAQRATDDALRALLRLF